MGICFLIRVRIKDVWEILNEYFEGGRDDVGRISLKGGRRCKEVIGGVKTWV